jgi:hypothetical protein
MLDPERLLLPGDYTHNRITGEMAMLRQLTAASLFENGLDGLEFNEFAMPVF